MSQRIKRLTKKIQKMSENYEREAVINNVIDEANQAIKAFTEIIQVGNKELDDIWKEYERIMAYVYKNDDANVSYDVVQLIDGTTLDIIILETKDVILVSSLGLIGKAKKHEQDEYSFEIGYQIALHRLIGKILNKLYGYKGE